MNTTQKPSEHAMRAAKEWLDSEASMEFEDAELARIIDQHAIAPAVAETITVIDAARNRAEDGMRQIEDIVGHYVSNPGLERNVVDLVRAMADRLAESQQELNTAHAVGSSYAKQLAEARRELAELRAEVARLKANIGCAREQGSTQYCAEVLGRDKRIAELEQDKARLQEKLDDINERARSGHERHTTSPHH